VSSRATRRTKRQQRATLLDVFTMDLIRSAREMGERVERQRVLDFLSEHDDAFVAAWVRDDIAKGKHDGGRVLKPVDLDFPNDTTPTETTS